jgi:hypothetical protein
MTFARALARSGAILPTAAIVYRRASSSTATLPLASRANASSFWIILLLVSRRMDHAMILESTLHRFLLLVTTETGFHNLSAFADGSGTLSLLT